MNRFRSAAIIAAVTAAPFLLAADATRPAGQPGAYTDPSYGFSITAPKLSDNPRGRGVAVVFEGPMKDGFAANVNVLVEPGRIGRREYLDAALPQLKETGGSLTNAKELTVAGYEAALLNYDMERNGRQLRHRQLLVFADRTTYIVTCTAAVDVFPQVEAEFQKTLDSFRPPPK
jgi:hypothetical protein